MREEFYRGIVEGMSCGVMTLDTQGRILTINEQARQILEIEEDIEGRSCTEVLRQHPRLSEVILGSFSCSTLPSRAELELTTRDERGRTIGFSISRIREAGGAELGAAMFFKDLTQVERQEEQERLRDRLVVLGEMAAQMAHEIRNPMASIAVTAQLVRRRLLAARKSTEAVDRISREVDRVERTIASCLEYVRPISPSLCPHPLRPLLEQAIAEARRHEKAAGVTLRLECGPGLDALPCDGRRLRELFYNILTNGIEAMEGKGTIAVRAWRARSFSGAAPLTPSSLGETEGCAVVQLSDTGPGIPEDLRDRVFFPFFTTKMQGTGIGLAMARKIAELHRGVIDVSGRAGEGATFTVKLPFAPPTPHETVWTSSISLDTDGVRER